MLNTTQDAGVLDVVDVEDPASCGMFFAAVLQDVL